MSQPGRAYGTHNPCMLHTGKVSLLPISYPFWRALGGKIYIKLLNFPPSFMKREVGRNWFFFIFFKIAYIVFVILWQICIFCIFKSYLPYCSQKWFALPHHETENSIPHVGRIRPKVLWSYIMPARTDFSTIWQIDSFLI